MALDLDNVVEKQKTKRLMQLKMLSYLTTSLIEYSDKDVTILEMLFKDLNIERKLINVFYFW